MDEWIYFLKTEKIETSFKAKGLKEAQKKLDIMKIGETERLKYESYQETRRDDASFWLSTYVQGEIKGREEGREEERLVVAHSMFKAGISKKQIHQITGISLEYLEKL